MYVETSEQEKRRLSLAEYASALEKAGTRTLPRSRTSFWERYERQAMLRMPLFHLEPPAPGEVRRILWNSMVAVASYIVDPDERHPANTWLYTCSDRHYSLEKLSKPAQRCVRRAKRSL